MKTTIKKSELKKIYDIACGDWKSKIEKYAQRNPFEDELSFTKEEVDNMVSASTKEQLSTVKEVFNILNSWENIKTLEDAINYLEDDEEIKLLNQLNNCFLPRHIIAEQELVVITKALNEKKEIDWDNSNEYKYFNWWYLGDNFRVNCVHCCYGTSDCSAHLCFKSEEIAEHSSKFFKDIYKDYMNK